MVNESRFGNLESEIKTFFSGVFLETKQFSSFNERRFFIFILPSPQFLSEKTTHGSESPKKVMGNVKHFASGRYPVVAVTKDEEIYHWGFINGEFFWSPEFVEKSDAKIKFVVAGNPFLLMGVESGDTFSIFLWGELGKGYEYDYPPVTKIMKPELLYSSNIKFRYCAAEFHAICVSFDGRVFGFGLNKYQQLSPYLEEEYYHKMVEIPFNKSQLYPAFDSLTKELSKEPIVGYSRVSVSEDTTILQEYVSCFGFLDVEEKSCRGHGVCVANETCKCFPGWGREECDGFVCVSKEKGVMVSCNGHGICTGPLECECDDGWSNYNQKLLIDFGPNSNDIQYGFCKYPACPSSDSNEICSSAGECKIDNTTLETKCICNSRFRGDACQYPRCNGVTSLEKKKDGCGYKSTCVNYNTCQCTLTGLNTLLPLTQSSESSKGCDVDGAKILGYVFFFVVVLGFCCLCVVSCCSIIWCLLCSLCGCCNVMCGVYCGCCCLFFRQKGKAQKYFKAAQVLQYQVDEEKHFAEFYNYCSPLQSIESTNRTNSIISRKSVSMSSSSQNLVEPVFSVDEKEEKELGIEFGFISETSSLLRSKNRIIRLNSTHIFHGDPEDGEGTIFYAPQQKKKKKRFIYPVFRGSFVNGRREGFGVEFKVHFEAYPVRDRKFFGSKENYRFAGFYKNDLREGKGTEYDDAGRETKVGEYVKDMLVRIISIDYPLRIIDLRREIEYLEDEGENSQLGSGGYGKILAGRLKEGEMYRDCAVKFFKDLHGLAVSKIEEKKQHTPFDDSIVVTWTSGGGKQYEQKLRDLEYRRIQQSVSDVLKILCMSPHPNITQVFGWSGPVEKISDFGYVMERCVCSVSHRYRERKLSHSEKILYLYQTALAMKHVHHVMGLIHRDLKWGNILLNSVNQIKICDFDISDRDEMDFSGRKNTSAMEGSFWHMAPELLLTGRFDYKYDVYSYGIMTYELLFEKLADPYEILKLRKCHYCNMPFELDKKRLGALKTDDSLETKNIVLNFMKGHFKRCNLRPRFTNYELLDNIDEEEGEEEEEEDRKVKVYRWQIRLMKRCFRSNPEKRPSFNEIVDIFDSFHSSKNESRGGKKKKKRSGRRKKNEEEKPIFGDEDSNYHSIN